MLYGLKQPFSANPLVSYDRSISYVFYILHYFDMGCDINYLLCLSVIFSMNQKKNFKLCDNVLVLLFELLGVHDVAYVLESLQNNKAYSKRT